MDEYSLPFVQDRWCRPWGTRLLFLGLTPDLRRGCHMPSLSGLGLGGAFCVFSSSNAAENFISAQNQHAAQAGCLGPFDKLRAGSSSGEGCPPGITEWGSYTTAWMVSAAVRPNGPGPLGRTKAPSPQGWALPADLRRIYGRWAGSPQEVEKGNLHNPPGINRSGTAMLRKLLADWSSMAKCRGLASRRTTT